MFCREQVAQLRDVVEEIRSRGAELAAVGSGNARQAKAFRQERGLTFDLYTDPDLVAYRAAGLRRDLASTFSFGALKNAARALGAGERQGTVQGDPWQQGGAFVIAPGDEVLFSQVSREAGDHADPRDLVAALPG